MSIELGRLHQAHDFGQDAWTQLPKMKRLLNEINACPAAQRAEALKTTHSFKTEMDDDARSAMSGCGRAARPGHC